MKNWLITLFIIGTLVTFFSFKESLKGTINNTPNEPITYTSDNISDTVKDIDGNVYHIIVIGTQTWMKENLKTTHYRDGSAITEVEDNSAWANIDNTASSTPAWCYYEGNPENNASYGKLYNYYAVDDPRKICPKGWHVPSDSEWTVLSNYLGGDVIAGGKMKSVTLWKSLNNIGADNSSGFTGLPYGNRDYYGSFLGIGFNGYWWSSTANGPAYAWDRYLTLSNGSVFRDFNNPSNGFSVRCVRDRLKNK